MRELKQEERKEENDIRYFKNKLDKMVNYIDEFDRLKKAFRKLRDKYLLDYISDQQNLELDAEFLNQKENMRERVKYLKTKLKDIKEKHVDEIKKTRKENTELIEKIEVLKKKIDKELYEKKEEVYIYL
jgi:hypothetical protein